MNKRLLIGIDGGATHSTAVAVLPDGSAAAVAYGEGLNFNNVGTEKVRLRIEGIVSEIGKKKFEYESGDVDPVMYEEIKEFCIDEVRLALDTDDKNVRDERMSVITDKVYAQFDEKYPDSHVAFGEILYKIQKYVVAELVYNEASHAYSESGYNPVKGMEMSDKYYAMEKARKSMKAYFKKVVSAFELDAKNYDERLIIEESKRDYEPYRFLYSAKREAMRLAKYIEL